MVSQSQPVTATADAATSGAEPSAQVVVLESFYSVWADQLQPSRMTIGQYDLRLTCAACPEQYDVFLGGKQVGYLRLRHGEFTAETPDSGGALVYEAEPLGDGVFEPEERAGFLVQAIAALAKVLGAPAQDGTADPLSRSGRTPK